MPVNVSGVFARRLRIEHNDPGTYGGACSPGLIMAKVITIIRDEHRSIAAILHGMQYLVNEIREYGSKVDLRVFWAMIAPWIVLWSVMHRISSFLLHAVSTALRGSVMDSGKRRKEYFPNSEYLVWT